MQPPRTQGAPHEDKGKVVSDRKRKQGREKQEQINAAADRQTLVHRVRKLITDAAYERVTEFRQYDGHWDGDEWQLGRCQGNVTTKMGQAFLADDVILWRERKNDFHDETTASYVTAYSVRNGIDTAIPAKRVRKLDTFYDAPGSLLRIGA
jgi:hypothetical protein